MSWLMHYQCSLLPTFASTGESSTNTNTSRGPGFINSEEASLEVSRLDQAVDFYLRQGLAPSTHKVYSSAQKRYSDFCSLHHLYHT